MTTLRQVEANHVNARLSTGPRTEKGKRKSRQNAVRHGLAAETVIGGEDYEAFQMAVASDFNAQTALERELVLRLASLLWRLRRATAIEAGLSSIQDQHERPAHREPQYVTGNFCRSAVARGKDERDQTEAVRNFEGSTAADDGIDQHDDLAQSFLRLNKLPSSPLDRLSRYEATLWQQARQILGTLRCLDQRKPWETHRSSEVRI